MFGFGRKKLWDGTKCLEICNMCLNIGFPWGEGLAFKAFHFHYYLWGLWSVRNKMGIEKKIPNSSNEFFSQNFHVSTEIANYVEGSRCYVLGRQNRKNENLVEGLL